MYFLKELNVFLNLKNKLIFCLLCCCHFVLNTTWQALNDLRGENMTKRAPQRPFRCLDVFFQDEFQIYSLYVAPSCITDGSGEKALWFNAIDMILILKSIWFGAVDIKYCSSLSISKSCKII